MAAATEHAATRMQTGAPSKWGSCCLEARHQVIPVDSACHRMVAWRNLHRASHPLWKCCVTGGHNVIGGLLDFLLERHPGSSLLAFKNGPRGILAKDFTEVTEDLMV